MKVQGETLIGKRRFDITFIHSSRLRLREWLAFQCVGFAAIIMGQPLVATIGRDPDDQTNDAELV